MEGRGVEEVAASRVRAIIEAPVVAAHPVARVTQGYVVGVVRSRVDLRGVRRDPAHFLVEPMVVAKGIPEGATGRDIGA